MKAKSAIVVGCGGIIGADVTHRLLEKGFKVIGVDVAESKRIKKLASNKNMIFVPGDIRDLGLFNMLTKVHYVFNCAGAFDAKQVASNRVAGHFINVVGVLNLLEYCVRDKVKFITGIDTFKNEGLLNLQQEMAQMMIVQYGESFGVKYLIASTENPKDYAKIMVSNMDKEGWA